MRADADGVPLWRGHNARPVALAALHAAGWSELDIRDGGAAVLTLLIAGGEAAPGECAEAVRCGAWHVRGSVEHRRLARARAEEILERLQAVGLAERRGRRWVARVPTPAAGSDG